MSGALVAQAINESIGTAGFQGLDAILKEYLGLIAEQAGTARVPISRTINGHSLASDVDLDNNDVGAAPAGFGLGGECVEVLDWNTATKNGFYSDTNGEERKHSPFLGMAAWGYTVAMKNADAITQVAFTYATPNWNHALVQKIRHLKGAEGWREWEWVNPPMEVGIEYRTTERWNGEPVYTRLIRFGSLPNASTALLRITDLSYSTLIAIDGVAFYNDDTMPLSSIATTRVRISQVSGGVIYITTDEDRTAWTAHIQLKYIKE